MNDSGGVRLVQTMLAAAGDRDKSPASAAASVDAVNPASNLAVSHWLGILISAPRLPFLSFGQGKYAGEELLPTHIAPV